jgi:hypothetical protein
LQEEFKDANTWIYCRTRHHFKSSAWAWTLFRTSARRGGGGSGLLGCFPLRYACGRFNRVLLLRMGDSTRRRLLTPRVSTVSRGVLLLMAGRLDLTLRPRRLFRTSARRGGGETFPYSSRSKAAAKWAGDTEFHSARSQSRTAFALSAGTPSATSHSSPRCKSSAVPFAADPMNKSAVERLSAESSGYLLPRIFR